MAKTYSLLAVACAVLLAQTASAQSKVGPLWTVYHEIADRHPFGKAPPAPPPPPQGPQTPQPTQEELTFARDMRVVYIRRSAANGELQVGIIDNRTKTTAILRVGDTSSDLNVTLVSASYEEAKAVVRRGTIEQEIFAGSGPPSAGGAGGSASAYRPSVTRVLTPGISYSERQKRRQEAAQRLKEEAEKQPKLSGDELTKHLQEYQMELIRAGGEKGPPLPLPLTKEMDDQLVREGVLPP